eukprot:scaffold151179_cov23-Tisochrysis_lutea.AAC.2
MKRTAEWMQRQGRAWAQMSMAQHRTESQAKKPSQAKKHGHRWAWLSTEQKAKRQPTSCWTHACARLQYAPAGPAPSRAYSSGSLRSTQQTALGDSEHHAGSTLATAKTVLYARPQRQ